MHKLIFLLLTGSILFTGCDVFKLATEETALSGNWSSNVVAAANECCHIDLTLDVDEEVITGSGLVKTPGDRIGEEFEFRVEVSGRFLNERLELESASDASPVFIQGSLDREIVRDETVLRVDFQGFGKMGQDIILFKR